MLERDTYPVACLQEVSKCTGPQCRQSQLGKGWDGILDFINNLLPFSVFLLFSVSNLLLLFDSNEKPDFRHLIVVGGAAAMATDLIDGGALIRNAMQLRGW